MSVVVVAQAGNDERVDSTEDLLKDEVVVEKGKHNNPEYSGKNRSTSHTQRPDSKKHTTSSFGDRTEKAGLVPLDINLDASTVGSGRPSDGVGLTSSGHVNPCAGEVDIELKAYPNAPSSHVSAPSAPQQQQPSSAVGVDSAHGGDTVHRRKQATQFNTNSGSANTVEFNPPPLSEQVEQSESVLPPLRSNWRNNRHSHGGVRRSSAVPTSTHNRRRTEQRLGSEPLVATIGVTPASSLAGVAGCTPATRRETRTIGSTGSESVPASHCVRPSVVATRSHRDSAAISDIGSDLMRVNGAIRPFKQLQKPSSMQSLPHSSQMNYNSEEVGIALVGVNSEVPRYTEEKGEAGNEPVDGADGIDANGKHSKPNVGYRLGKRKELFEKRKRISDYALVFGMFGIIVMVVETELSMAHVYDKVSYLKLYFSLYISLYFVYLMICERLIT